MELPETVTVKVYFEDGQLWAEVEEFPGCFASGFTQAELEESLSEGLSLYLSEPGHPVRAELVKKRAEERPLPEFVEHRSVRLCAA